MDVLVRSLVLSCILCACTSETTSMWICSCEASCEEHTSVYTIPAFCSDNIDVYDAGVLAMSYCYQAMSIGCDLEPAWECGCDCIEEAVEISECY